jgi:hypothetical protein
MIGKLSARAMGGNEKSTMQSEMHRNDEKARLNVKFVTAIDAKMCYNAPR